MFRSITVLFVILFVLCNLSALTVSETKTSADTRINYYKSGTIRDAANVGIAGVTIMLMGSPAATTNSSGYYSFMVSGFVSLGMYPTKNGYTFSPVSRTLNPGNEANLDFTGTLLIPNPSTAPSPTNGAGNVANTSDLGWAAANYNATGYKLFFGTDNPPTNLVNGTNLGNVLTYNPSTDLLMSTTYYWKIVPYNAAGDALNCPVWSFTTQAPPLPGFATNPSPANSDVDVAVSTGFLWSQGTGAVPSGYRLSLGLDNPPTGILSNSDLGNVTSYTSPASLAYNTVYYWKVTPYNGSGDASDNPIWSFTTIDYYSVGESNLTTDGGLINPNLTIPNLTGAFSPSVAFSWNPAEITLPNTGLVIRLTNENFAGRTLNINPNLGYIPAQIGYRILPNLAWTIIDQQPEWTAASIVITLPAAKADGDVDIVFPDVEGSTLPVELSSFTAIPATDCNSVSLSWTVESETDHLGYDIIRSLDNNLNHAQKVNSFIITEGSHTGTQIVFHYNDADLENAETYFYWLASSSLGGEIEFYGPISVNLSASPDGNEPPIIPNLTALQNAYPNPFNPNVTIAYTLEKAADVRIHIFNNKGQMVRILLDATKAAGTAHLVWDGKSDNGDNLPSGIYYVQMQAENSKSTRKIVMLK